jgi:hypothetical protein
MAHVLPLLVDAREFFRRPEANRDLLAREQVDYVVFVRPGPWIGTAGGIIPADGDLAAVESLPDLRPVYEDDELSVFAVGERGADIGSRPRRCAL